MHATVGTASYFVDMPLHGFSVQPWRGECSRTAPRTVIRRLSMALHARRWLILWFAIRSETAFRLDGQNKIQTGLNRGGKVTTSNYETCARNVDFEFLTLVERSSRMSLVDRCVWCAFGAKRLLPPHLGVMRQMRGYPVLSSYCKRWR